MKGSPAARGVTLLEVVVSSVVMTVIVTISVSMIRSASTSQADDFRHARLDDTARMVVEEMSGELRRADRDTLSVSPYGGSDRVEFRFPASYVQDSVVWGPFVQFRCETSSVDANNNGVVDEGCVVRVEGNRSRTLCNFVASGGLTFLRTGGNVLLRLRLISTDDRGRPIESVAETSVTARNSSLR